MFSDLKPFHQIVWNFKEFVFNRYSTDWLTSLLACLLTYLLTDRLTDLLMPSDNHNSRTTRATDFIFSLINIASSGDMTFHQLQLLQCLASWCYLCTFTTVYRWRFAVDVQWLQWEITEALFIPFLVYNALKQVQHCWNWGIMVFTHQDMGCTQCWGN